MYNIWKTIILSPIRCVQHLEKHNIITHYECTIFGDPQYYDQFCVCNIWITKILSPILCVCNIWRSTILSSILHLLQLENHDITTHLPVPIIESFISWLSNSENHNVIAHFVDATRMQKIYTPFRFLLLFKCSTTKYQELCDASSQENGRFVPFSTI